MGRRERLSSIILMTSGLPGVRAQPLDDGVTVTNLALPGWRRWRQQIDLTAKIQVLVDRQCKQRPDTPIITADEFEAVW